MSKSTQFTVPETVWAGTEQSLTLASEAHQAILAGPSVSLEPENQELPYMLSIQGSVGVISITGPLVNRDSEYNRYYGVSSYSDIRRALVAAAQSPTVKGILLDINSGGGAVSGLGDTANLVRLIHSSVKPVVAFADGGMLSAAYWLGVSAGSVYASATSLIGSIGVITTHTEYSKALKEAGIGVTVLRAGEFKALASNVEPLSDAAAKQIQHVLEGTYQVFIGHVAEMRGGTVQAVDEAFGQGREFLGQAAVDVGALDAITTFDELLGQFQAQIVDTDKFLAHNYGNSNKGPAMTKKALTAVEIAAMGVTTPAVTPPAVEPSATEPTAEQVAAAVSEAAKVTELEMGNLKAANQILTTQLSQAQIQLAEANLKLQQVEQSVEPLKAAAAGLSVIVATSLSNMKVALNAGQTDVTKLSAEQLLAEHAATSEVFAKKFPVGGVAAVTAPEAEAEASAPLPTNHLARVNATRFTRN